MRKSLVALSFAAGLALVYGQSAIALPANPNGLKESATAASTVEQAQYSEHRARHGVVKCYRDLVIGPYRCHYFRNGQLNLGL
jgi:hypothetical protein